MRDYCDTCRKIVDVVKTLSDESINFCSECFNYTVKRRNCMPLSSDVNKIGNQEFRPTSTDLQAWRDVFEAESDKNFKVFTYDSVNIVCDTSLNETLDGSSVAAVKPEEPYKPNQTLVPTTTDGKEPVGFVAGENAYGTAAGAFTLATSGTFEIVGSTITSNEIVFTSDSIALNKIEVIPSSPSNFIWHGNYKSTHPLQYINMTLDFDEPKKKITLESTIKDIIAEKSPHDDKCKCIVCEFPRGSGWGEYELERRLVAMAQDISNVFYAFRTWLFNAKTSKDNGAYFVTRNK